MKYVDFIRAFLKATPMLGVRYKLWVALLEKTK